MQVRMATNPNSMTQRFVDHERVMDLVVEALDRPPAEREAFLSGACGTDASLRAQLRQMLLDASSARDAFDRGARQAALAALRISSAGDVGSYRLIRLLGQGGMGAVYLAEQRRTQRRVAIKLMRPGFVTPEGLGRFEYEAELLGRLDHAGIAQIYEAGVTPLEEGAQPYFAMEYVEGRRLDEFVAQHGSTLPLRARLELLISVCRAVHYAHTRGVIHRDLKPANILITPEGNPKILDFGVARVTDSGRGVAAITAHTASGQLVGTLPYMSPEQACGATRELDPSSDVYALGLIAYEMLSGGRRAYDVSDLPVHEAVRVICERVPPRLGALDRALRGDVETIVGKALQKD
jgi:serine/threonine protein kinase